MENIGKFVNLFIKIKRVEADYQEKILDNINIFMIDLAGNKHDRNDDTCCAMHVNLITEFMFICIEQRVFFYVKNKRRKKICQEINFKE